MTRRNPTILGIWGVLLLLTAIMLGSLPVFTFGLVCFSALLYLWLKERRGPRNIYVLNGIMFGLCILWFAANLAVEILSTFPVIEAPRLMISMMSLAFAFPPLIVHLFYLESLGATGEEPTRGWKLLILAFYVVSTGFLVAVPVVTWARREPSMPVVIGFQLALFALLLAGGILSGIRLSRMPKNLTDRARRGRRATQAVIAFMIALIVIATFTFLTAGGWWPEVLSFISRATPLFFVFASAYYESRFQFFDVFVKRATLFFVLMIGLVAYFRYVPSWFPATELGELAPWVYAVTLVPVALALPWAFGVIEGWLDRVWLGRSFTAGEAMKSFLEDVKSATTEEELLEAASEGIATVFQCPVEIQLNETKDRTSPEFVPSLVVSIPQLSHSGGVILLGPRANQTPFFSQDRAVVSTLAEILSFLLENVGLQRRKQEQEKREQQLVLEASRSELKALRAQINPHFLFNALNAIASLVYRNPELAEETVERLAEVFRYTLSRSEKEWVAVEEELEFARAYLDVERARFGDRLAVEFDVGEGVREVRIPVMLVQTLVENAVKHGVSKVKGVGRIRISAGLAGEGVEIKVEDNGPGPAEQGGSRWGASGSIGASYGLRNVTSRLVGYYGERAQFQLSRDEAEGTTVARLTLPVNGDRSSGERTA